MLIDARDSMKIHLARLNETLNDGRPYVLGEQFTLADVGLVTIFERLEVAGGLHLLEPHDHVKAYWSRLKARPSYKIAVQDEELSIIVTGKERIEHWKQDSDWFRRDVYQHEA